MADNELRDRLTKALMDAMGCKVWSPTSPAGASCLRHEGEWSRWTERG